MHTLFTVAEVVDQIIDCVHDDPVALRSCALVARHWVASSRFHLFGEIVIMTEGALQRIEKALNTISWLGHCTQKLTIRIPRRSLGVPTRRTDYYHISSDRILELAAAAPALIFLRLVALIIEDEGSTRLLEDFCSAKIYVRELAFENCDFCDQTVLLRVLLAFPYLKKLSFVRCRGIDNQMPEELVGMLTAIRRISVETLHWVDYGGLSKHWAPMVIQALDDDSPRVFYSLLEGKDDQDFLVTFCALAKSRINELHLELFNYYEGSSKSIALFILQQRHLFLKTSYHQPSLLFPNIP